MEIQSKSSGNRVVLFGIFLVIVVLGYVGLSLFFMGKIRELGAANQELISKSKNLETTLESVKAENKSFIEKLESDKKDLKDSFDAIKKENETLRFSLTKIETQHKNAIAEKRALEEMLVNKTREIENVKTQQLSVSANAQPAPATTTFAPNTPQDIVDKIKEKDSEIRNLAEQNRILSEKLEKLYKTMNEKITQISIAKIALEETVTEARKKINEEWNTVNLGSIDLAKTSTAAEPANAGVSTPSGPKKEGKVLAVNEDQGFVVVDMGKIDNLNADSKLVVKRDGKYVATLSILEIRDVMSACHIKILQDGQKIQVNDLVTIRK